MNTLQTLIFLLGAALFLKLAVLRAITLGNRNISRFELDRQLHKGGREVEKIAIREQYIEDVASLRHLVTTLITVLMIVCFFHSLGPVLGLTLSVVTLLEVGMVARVKSVKKYAQSLYEKYEDKIIDVAKKLHPLLRFMRDVSVPSLSDTKPYSKEELLHLIEESHLLLTDRQRKLLLTAIKFEDKKVQEIMTPRSVVETINASEVLGPITLDHLHKSGHSRFPVLDKEEHIVGLLYLHDLISEASSKKKVTVRDVMDSKVFYINEQQNLSDALDGFLRVQHHLFIVVNEFEEVVGIVTIEDVVEALIGRKIVDEFDQYDDLRAVAKQQAIKHQKSTQRTHITQKRK